MKLDNPSLEKVVNVYTATYNDSEDESDDGDNSYVFIQ